MLESGSFVELHIGRTRIPLRNCEARLSKVRLPTSSEKCWTDTHPYCNSYCHRYTDPVCDCETYFDANEHSYCDINAYAYKYSHTNTNTDSTPLDSHSYSNTNIIVDTNTNSYPSRDTHADTAYRFGSGL